MLAGVLLPCAVGMRPAAQEGAAPPTGTATLQDDAGPPAGGTDAAAAATAPPTYSGADKRDRLLSAWLGTGLAERVDLGVASAGGRELFVVQFGAPGTKPLSDRTTLLLVGGLDGVSLAGSEAVVRLVERLLAAPAELPPEVTFVAVPWANPDGLARWRDAGCGEGRNARPTDDDQDGRLDEDGPDDLDGDGLVLEMLVEDSAGPWVRAADGRFLRPALEGEAPRYRRMREGRDDDGDGLFNEDGPGGVVLDRNFPLSWEGPWSGEPSGPWPLSEPCSRALADLARGRRVVAALFFQGNHGLLAAPGARRGGIVAGMAEPLPLAGDEPAYLALTELFSRRTGRALHPPVRLAEARGREVPGSPVDWLYVARGVLAMEVGVWGPGIEPARENGAGIPRAEEGGFRRGIQGEGAPFAGVSEADRAWARWLDDTRGGIGFVDWQPVDLGDGRGALVGGWEPRTCINPPPDLLPRALQGLEGFVLGIAQGLPRLDVEVRAVERDGLVVRLRVRVRNGGALPTGAGPLPAGGAGHIELVLPEGTTLLAGEAVVPFDHLPGGAASPEGEWLLTAPEGAVLGLRVSSPFCEASMREVRLP